MTTHPPYLTRRQRRRAGVAMLKVSRVTHALILDIVKGGRLPRTVDDVVYELAARALDSNGPSGPAARVAIETGILGGRVAAVGLPIAGEMVNQRSPVNQFRTQDGLPRRRKRPAAE